MSALRDKIIKNSSIKYTDILLDSKLFNEKDIIHTKVPIINVGLSGYTTGGLMAGVTMFAGPSKNYKTGFALLMAKTFQEAYPDGVILFYDSEFGAPKPYFEAFKIDMSNVIHTPITDIEELKHDLMSQLQNIERSDKVLIIIDSIGNLASRKEVEDAIEGKTVADMTRAKALKSLFRMITPHLALKNIPLIAINHTYKEIGMFPKDIVGGGCVDGSTHITMEDGSTKNMSEIIVGDKVITLDGPREVTHTWTPNTLEEGYPERYEVEFDDHVKVVVSKSHRFLTKNGWKFITDITESDEIVSAL